MSHVREEFFCSFWSTRKSVLSLWVTGQTSGCGMRCFLASRRRQSPCLPVWRQRLGNNISRSFWSIIFLLYGGSTQTRTGDLYNVNVALQPTELQIHMKVVIDNSVANTRYDTLAQQVCVLYIYKYIQFFLVLLWIEKLFGSMYLLHYLWSDTRHLLSLLLYTTSGYLCFLLFTGISLSFFRVFFIIVMLHTRCL